MLKTVVLVNIFVDTMIYFRIESSKEHYLLETDILL